MVGAFFPLGSARVLHEHTSLFFVDYILKKKKSSRLSAELTLWGYILVDNP